MWKKLGGIMVGWLLFGNPAFSGLTHIGASELAALLDERKAVVVDLRREDEWRETGIIEGSSLNTFFDNRGRYDANEWLTGVMAQASQDTALVLVCQHGVRSKVVSQWLENTGLFDEIYNLKDGIVEWRETGQRLHSYP